VKEISSSIEETMTSRHFVKWLIVLMLLLTACSTQFPETCPEKTPIGLANADEIAANDSLPFRFPLDESPIDETLYFGWFGVSNECPPGKVDCYVYPERLYHAAEDYKRPAGTAVYAMADGVIRFSGPAEGYGWLILIDHPQANLYSLYGHLSPSRWRQQNGKEVARGELIAYLGDSDENGGSEQQPVETHLHFGIRAGQTRDYPSRGEWRTMGGWIKLCPQDVGWLSPSTIITEQEIPTGGFQPPPIEFWTRWGFELFFNAAYIVSGIGIFVSLSRKKNRFSLLLPGALLIVAGIIIERFGLVRGYAVPIAGMLLLALGFFYMIRRSKTEVRSATIKGG
jgi:murein DD-endopeptidase MepM/ murein hydrolase activator NlpD